jgi:hypothetical protein
MYIENKSSENTSGLVGVARMGRVAFSKTGRTIYYNGKSFQSLNETEFKANFMTSKVEKSIGFLVQRRTALIAGRARHL